MKCVIALLVSLAAVLGQARGQQRIFFGNLTTINQYPQAAVVLTSYDFVYYSQHCGSTILTNFALLSAAHCYSFSDNNPARYRIRVGSSFASSGGVVHMVQQIINHPNFNTPPFDNDVAIIRTASAITFNNVVQPGSIAGSTYNVADNQVVWVIGWGWTELLSFSEQLRHVQIWTVNQDICRQRYGSVITDNMICSGWLDVGDRDACTGDSGGPLLHNNVVVGVTSFGSYCGNSFLPGVYARVSRYTNWILANV